MSNFNRQLVALTMATLRADGKMDAAEIEVIKKVAADLGCSADETTKLLLEENQWQLTHCPEITKYITEVGNSVENREDKQLIMEACILVALADKVLTTKEVAVLLMICQALKSPLDRMVCDIAIVAQNDRSIKIEGSDANFDENESLEVTND